MKTVDNRRGSVTADGLVQYYEQLSRTPAGLIALRKALEFVDSKDAIIDMELM